MCSSGVDFSPFDVCVCESQLHVVLLEVPLYCTLKSFSANQRAEEEEEEEAASQGDYTPQMHHTLEAFIINTVKYRGMYTQIELLVSVYYLLCAFIMPVKRTCHACMHFGWMYFRHLGEQCNAMQFSANPFFW